jgi:hypothetical protein
MVGKLYVLSMFYTMLVLLILPTFPWFDTISHIIFSNSQPLHPGEQPTTFISTLTVPAEVMCTFTIEALGSEMRCGDSAAERGTASTVDFAV